MATNLEDNLHNIFAFTKSNLVPENIRKGINVFNIQGNYTSDANALSNEILENKSAYVNGEKIIGTLPIANPYPTMRLGEQTTGLAGENYIVTTMIDNPIAFPNGGGILVNISQNFLATSLQLTSGMLKNGVNLLGVTGNVTELVGTNLNVIPSITAQSITPNFPYNAFTLVNIPAVNASIDSNIQANNIKSGVNILGVVGNVEPEVQFYNKAIWLANYDVSGINNHTITELIRDKVELHIPYAQMNRLTRIDGLSISRTKPETGDFVVTRAIVSSGSGNSTVTYYGKYLIKNVVKNDNYYNLTLNAISMVDYNSWTNAINLIPNNVVENATIMYTPGAAFALKKYSNTYDMNVALFNGDISENETVFVYDENAFYTCEYDEALMQLVMTKLIKQSSAGVMTQEDYNTANNLADYILR